jgi:hypothetical protein
MFTTTVTLQNGAPIDLEKLHQQFKNEHFEFDIFETISKTTFESFGHTII